MQVGLIRRQPGLTRRLMLGAHTQPVLPHGAEPDRAAGQLAPRHHCLCSLQVCRSLGQPTCACTSTYHRASTGGVVRSPCTSVSMDRGPAAAPVQRRRRPDALSQAAVAPRREVYG